MSNKLEITIDVIIHATEDIKKFYDAFEESFGITKKQFDIQELTGHFDNPITILTVQITKDAARQIIDKIKDISEILEPLDQRMDDSSLYIRLDKQEFVQGNIVLGEENAIKLKIYTPVYNKKEILQAYQALLGLQLN